MLSCWSTDPVVRPKFSSLVSIMGGFLERDSGYLDLSQTSGSEYVQLSRALTWKNTKSSGAAVTSHAVLPTVHEQELECASQQDEREDQLHNDSTV